MAASRACPARLRGVAGAVLLAAAAAVIVIAVRAQRSAPQPPRTAASPVQVIPTRPPDRRANATAPVTRGLLLPRSIPIRLAIPAIGVDTALRPIGLDRTGHIQTPPLDRDSHAYWLSVSPTPGQLGPATIIGHVDSAAYGPAVFFRLGDLRQRDIVDVTRSDGTTAVFEVERVVVYPKARFPTQAVYGNLDHAGLRLITCGGLFDPAAHSYESNIVVYASLVAVHDR